MELSLLLWILTACQIGESVRTLPDGDPPDPGRVALLVGIDRYAPDENRGFLDLTGCANDVRAMRDMLIRRFHFRPGDVHVLLNEQATHERIVGAIHQFLIEPAVEGTEAVLYLSGHGSRVPDTSGYLAAEPDGLDSTFVAYDSRVGGMVGQRDLCDDELRSLIQALTVKTARVTIITDSCHAGDILREGQVVRTLTQGRRPMDREWVRGFWPAEIPLLEDSPGQELPVNRYLHLAAATRYERAFEVTDPVTGDRRGVFTLLLVRALETDSGSWRAIRDDLAVRLRAWKPQTVEHRGDIDRLPFGVNVASTPGFASEDRGRRGLWVCAGWLQGIRVGMLLEIRGAQGETRVGEAQVEAVTALAARARWDRPPEEHVDGALRAIVLSRPGGVLPLRVWTKIAHLIPGLQQSPLAEYVELGQDPDYVIVRSGSSRGQFQTAEGVLIGDRFPTRGLRRAASIDAVLRMELDWKAMEGLVSASGELDSLLTFRGHREGDPKPKDAELYQPVEILGGAQMGVVRVRSGPGTGGRTPLGVLAMTNPTDRTVYANLFSLEEDTRRIRHIAQATIGPRGQAVQLYEISLDAKWPLIRTMRDRVLMITTARPVDLTSLESGVQRSENDIPSVLKTLLRPALGRSALSISPDGWGVTVLDVMVEPAR